MEDGAQAKKEDPLGDCPQTEEVITDWSGDNDYEQTGQNDDGYEGDMEGDGELMPPPALIP